VELEFEDSALREISEVSHQLNVSLENIGARRLHTVCEKVLENLLFELPDPKIRKVAVNALYVQDNIADILKDEDLSRYIL
jgi:ATP-dependent HslUV protease ATP-binding subunit HslU